MIEFQDYPRPIQDLQLDDSYMYINQRFEEQQGNEVEDAAEDQVVPVEAVEGDQDEGLPPYPQSPPCCTLQQTLWKIVTRITRAQRYHTTEGNPMSEIKLQKWKMRCFYWSIVILAICTFNLIRTMFQVIGMHAHHEFFSAQKFTDLLLLDDSYYPTYSFFVTYLIILLTLFSLKYVARPEFQPFFYHFLNLSQILLVLGIVVFIAQLVSYQIQFPDEAYENKLKEEMTASLNDTLNNGRTAPIIWRNTQFIFRCCGIYDSNDWSNHSLPHTCCKPLDVNNKDSINGCLESQMNAFKSNDYRLHFSLLLEYIPFVIHYVCLAEIYAHSNL